MVTCAGILSSYYLLVQDGAPHIWEASGTGAAGLLPFCGLLGGGGNFERRALGGGLSVLEYVFRWGWGMLWDPLPLPLFCSPAMRRALLLHHTLLP